MITNIATVRIFDVTFDKPNVKNLYLDNSPQSNAAGDTANSMAFIIAFNNSKKSHLQANNDN
jgi:hypothetical protein